MPDQNSDRAGKDRPLEERQSEATSDETLGEIEESEKAATSCNNVDPGPSPDGALDESEEQNDAGPM